MGTNFDIGPEKTSKQNTYLPKTVMTLLKGFAVQKKIEQPASILSRNKKISKRSAAMQVSAGDQSKQ